MQVRLWYNQNYILDLILFVSSSKSLSNFSSVKSCSSLLHAFSPSRLRKFSLWSLNVPNNFPNYPDVLLGCLLQHMMHTADLFHEARSQLNSLRKALPPLITNILAGTVDYVMTKGSLCSGKNSKILLISFIIAKLLRLMINWSPDKLSLQGRIATEP